MIHKIIFGQIIHAFKDTNQLYISLTLQNDVCINPSSVYVEESADVPDQQGHSIHVCDTGGTFGGFDELECNTQTFTGGTSRSVGSVKRQNRLYFN